MTVRLRRRSVLGLLAGLAAGAAPGLPALGRQPAGDALGRICARAGREPELAALGRAWCAEHPHLARPDLLAALAAELPEPGLGEAEIVATLRARATEDFRARRIVALDGWRLSLTEARICAAGVAPELLQA
jgi:hypothetical protein